MNKWQKMTNKMTADSWVPIIFGSIMTFAGVNEGQLIGLFIGLPSLTYGLITRVKEQNG
jgi:uncharacterized membrane protein